MSQAHLSKSATKSSPAKLTTAKPKCVYKGLKIFGDAWTLFIISSLSDGEKRFCELQRKLNDVNPVTLSTRLKKLEKLGFIKRKEETIDKLSVTYSLAKKGIGMVPIIKEIETYAKKYIH